MVSRTIIDQVYSSSIELKNSRNLFPLKSKG